MQSQRKIKFLIALALLLIICLLTVVVFQLINISKTNKKISLQQEQIQQLQQELDYHKNKLPSEKYNPVTEGEAIDNNNNR